MRWVHFINRKPKKKHADCNGMVAVRWCGEIHAPVTLAFEPDYPAQWAWLDQTEDSQDGWTRTSERLPCAEDLNELRQLWVTRHGGNVVQIMLQQFDSEHHIAWQRYDNPKPEPYVPPEPEKPERREWWAVTNPESYVTVWCESEQDAVNRSCGKVCDIRHVREVLPGDVDPDKARELLQLAVRTFDRLYRYEPDKNDVSRKIETALEGSSDD